jgi:ketosteroid isomerase-like protein
MTAATAGARSPDPAADRAAIVQLTIDYCWALDTHDWEALRDVFTPDVVGHLGAGGQQGCDQIIERVSSVLEPLDDSQHMVTSHQVRIDGDTATSRCYLHAQHVRHAAEGGPNYVVAGRYEDRFVRTDAGWRIAERRLVVMWTEGNRGVVQAR